MDGSGRSIIVDTKITWPNGLTVDYVTERIYWADAREDYIEFASLDGSNRHVGPYASEAAQSLGGLMGLWRGQEDIVYRHHKPGSWGFNTLVLPWDWLRHQATIQLLGGKRAIPCAAWDNGLRGWAQEGYLKSPQPCVTLPRRSYVLCQSSSVAVGQAVMFNLRKPQKPLGLGFIPLSGLRWDSRRSGRHRTQSVLGANFCSVSPASPPTVLSQDIPHIFALTLFEDYVYWTDWETKSINRAHKTTGANKTLLISTLHRPMDLHVFHALRQPDGKGGHTAGRCRKSGPSMNGLFSARVKTYSLSGSFCSSPPGH